MHGLAGATIAPASGDASFRRYFRVSAGGLTRIAMDAPPNREDSRPYIRVANHFESIGINSPRVLAADLDRGFLLLTDLGSTQYLTELKEHPARAPGLYADALQALIRMQEQSRHFHPELPPYDRKLLQFELSLFSDWLCARHLHLEIRGPDLGAWQACCNWLVASALRQPPVFVHRDYHSRNLMVTAADNPGVLDFQDAVVGPFTYDLVSLLKDCYIKWPAEQVRAWAMDFYSGIDADVHEHMTADEFMRSFDLMGVQRHLKAAGIFARLKERDGKSSYMDDVPRTLQYITDIAPRYDELSFLSRWIDEQVLPRLRKHP
ncbi:MAG: aminoglycoside phosphotransferase family protein [Woeseiaceae bacterium]